MDLNGLNWCFFPIQSLYPILNGKFCGIFHSQCASVRFVGSVRRGVRCGEDVGGFGNVGNCD